MNVLSLFDGTATGFQALKDGGFPVTRYFASEVDTYAMKVAKKNHPEIIHIGDVQDVRFKPEKGVKIDLLIGGSPCQGFSFAGKQLNFEDPRSKLFFEFVRLLKETKPTYFLLENVCMKKEYQDIITEHLGVEPILINSSLLSAQNRKRLYWTNIPGVTQPEDKNILLKDIVHENAFVDRDKSFCLDANYFKGGNLKQYFEKSRRQLVFEDLKEYIVPFDHSLQILEKEVPRGKVGYFRKDSHANRVYYTNGKSVTLLGDAGGGAAKMGQYLFGRVTAHAGEKKILSSFNESDKFYTMTAQGNHGVVVEGYIRKLTPVECERLQTLPDGYTDVEGVSKTQRYKMLGNGWTKDVIQHIFSFMKE